MGILEKNTLVAFEHESFRFNLENPFEKDFYNSIEKYFGDGSIYFDLIYKGVKFKEYVGVIQIGNYKIEVLPKADSSSEEQWRDRLISMLRTIWDFEVKATSFSNLKIKPNSILELYFSLFLDELEVLLRMGLIKKYSPTEGNLYALKGALQFNKHLNQNITHQERFYVRYTNYNVDHKIHQILNKVLTVIEKINNNIELSSVIGRIKINFPETNDISITQSLFHTITFDRKNEHYKKALNIAKMILLNYHPNVLNGKNSVIALMFDMNILWEKFVHVILKKHTKEWIVKDQISKDFWKPNYGYKTRLKADILIEKNGSFFVIDTKWKILNGKNPSSNDLRQMYVYNSYYNAQKSCLVYPSEMSDATHGKFLEQEKLTYCSVIQIGINKNFASWKNSIGRQIEQWLETITH